MIYQLFAIRFLLAARLFVIDAIKLADMYINCLYMSLHHKKCAISEIERQLYKSDLSIKRGDD